MSNGTSIMESLLSVNTKQSKVLNGLELINITFVIEIVRALSEVYQFENFVFYVSERFELSTDRVAENLARFFEVFPLIPKTIYYSRIESHPSFYHIDHFVNSHTLCMIYANGPNDDVMELAAESMKQVRIFKTIFILSTHWEDGTPTSTNEAYDHIARMINQTYNWIWYEQFIYTIILTVRDQVYMLDPYPKFNIINKTENWRVTDFFIDYHNDLKGYVVDTVIRYDLPRVFNQRHEHDQLLLSGTSGELFTAFIKSINATLVDSSGVPESAFEPAEMEEMVALVLDRSIEMSPHSFTALFAIEQVGISYPIGINDWCIMVPFYNSSPEHLYLIHSFQQSTWLLIFLAIVYISIALWLCAPERYKNYYSYSLLHALSSLVGVVSKTLYDTPNPRMRFLYLFMFIFSFLTSNWYTTKIASYLVTSLPSSQINTIDDVIRANLRIKVFDYEYTRLLHMPAQYPPRFLQQLDIVDKHFMDLHRDTLNTSFGYSIQTDRWEFLNMQQEFLEKPLFRRSDICMGPFYHVFPLYSDSHLQIPFTYFIMYVMQSGFFTYWHRSAFADALRLNLVKILLVDEEPRPLSLRFLLPIWYVWFLGLTIAFILFVFEVKRERLKRFKLKIVRRSGLRRNKEHRHFEWVN